MQCKICGITTLTEVAYANELKPDYIGIVLAPSKRRITMETAAKIRNGLREEDRKSVV